MEKFLTICHDQFLGTIYSVTEQAVISIQIITLTLLSTGLVSASIFLTKTVLSTKRLFSRTHAGIS